MRRDTTDCDRCEASVEDRDFKRQGIMLPIPTGNHPNEYTTEERRLCNDCRVELLEFIDGDDAPDRSDLVGGRLRADLAKSLTAASVQLRQTADDIVEGGREGDE